MREIVYALGRMAVPVVFIVFGVIQFMNIDIYIARPSVLKFVALTGDVLPPVVAYAVAASI